MGMSSPFCPPWLEDFFSVKRTMKDILDAIGHTPLVELARMSPKPGIRLFAKLEGYNPTGSLKDRIAKYMIDTAEKEGKLTPDKIILEPTSGNTGISLAMIAQRKDYKVKVVMPENVNPEVKDILRAFGVEMVFSEAIKGTNGAIKLAQELAQHKGYFMPFQYGNEANPLAHYETTGVEILEDLPEVDIFVAGLGTGGTLMGVGRRLKEYNPNIKVIAVAPYPGDRIPGLRSLEEGFIPPILDLKMLDGRILVENKNAFRTTRELFEKEGIFAGISSGAVLYGAIRVARRINSGNIVALLADGGWKYLSSGLWTKDVSEIEGEIESKIWW